MLWNSVILIFTNWLFIALNYIVFYQIPIVKFIFSILDRITCTTIYMAAFINKTLPVFIDGLNQHCKNQLF